MIGQRQMETVRAHESRRPAGAALLGFRDAQHLDADIDAEHQASRLAQTIERRAGAGAEVEDRACGSGTRDHIASRHARSWPSDSTRFRKS
jgi:hypothetical protein